MKSETSIVLRPEYEWAHLSPGQRRLWILHQFDSRDASWNRPLAVQLTGRLDVSALDRSLKEIVGRHGILRSVFAEIDGEPVQRAQPLADIDWEVRDLGVLPERKRLGEARRIAAQEAIWPRPIEPLIPASRQIDGTSWVERRTDKPLWAELLGLSSIVFATITINPISSKGLGRIRFPVGRGGSRDLVDVVSWLTAVPYLPKANGTFVRSGAVITQTQARSFKPDNVNRILSDLESKSGDEAQNLVARSETSTTKN